MREKQSVKYPLTDTLSIVATLKNTGEQGKMRMISLKLIRVDDEEVAIASKKFAWPEPTLPKNVKLVDDDQALILNGTSNIAHVCLRGKLDSASVCARRFEAAVTDIPVYTSLSSHEISSVPSFSAQVSQCLKYDDSDKSWKALVRLGKQCSVKEPAADAFLTLREQLSLVKLVKAHSDDKSSGKVISLIISKHLVTESRACTKLFNTLMALNDIKNVIEFVRSMTVIDESIFARCLKLIANMDPDDNVDLFDLLEKPFDENALTYAIHEELTVHEVITLVNRLVDYCCSTRSETVCAKALKMLSVLIDSHCQRFVWESSCYDAIQRAASTISDMIKVIDLCRQLDQRLQLNESLNAEEVDPNSDYVIRRVELKRTLI